LQCQGAIASGSVYLPVRLGGRSATSVLPVCSPLLCRLSVLQPPYGCLVGLSSISGLFVLGWCNACALHEQLALAWCGCAFLYGLHGCHLCFYARWHQLCGSCRCARLVRPISAALTGRETNGGNPMVLAAAAGHCYHALWRVQLAKQLERRLLTGAQRVLCSGGSWGFGGLPQ
jgi:hypothetical protein